MTRVLHLPALVFVCLLVTAAVAGRVVLQPMGPVVAVALLLAVLAVAELATVCCLATAPARDDRFERADQR